MRAGPCRAWARRARPPRAGRRRRCRGRRARCRAPAAGARRRTGRAGRARRASSSPSSAQRRGRHVRGQLVDDALVQEVVGRRLQQQRDLARRRARVPRSGARTPAATRSSVLFPAPLRPSSATVSPAPQLRSRPRSAVTVPAAAVVELDPHVLRARARPWAPSRRLRRRRDGRRRSGSGSRADRGHARAAQQARASFTVTGSGPRPASENMRAAGGTQLGTGARGPLDELRAVAVAGDPAVARARSRGPPPRGSARGGARRAATVVPHSSFRRRSCASSSSPATGSSCEVGSSSSSRRGPAASAAASATRCSSPPERVRTGRSSRSAMPSASAVSSTARASARAAHAAALERQLDLRAHAVHHDLRLRVLEARGRPTSASRAGPVRRACRGPQTRTRPASSPPKKCGTRPQAARSSVDLPLPDTPASTTSSPSPSGKRHVVERRPARARIAVGDALEAQRVRHGAPRGTQRRAPAQPRARTARARRRQHEANAAIGPRPRSARSSG